MKTLNYWKKLLNESNDRASLTKLSNDFFEFFCKNATNMKDSEAEYKELGRKIMKKRAVSKLG